MNLGVGRRRCPSSSESLSTIIGIRTLSGPGGGVRVAGKSAISQARTRLGWEPLARLFESVVTLVATRRTRGAWYRGRQLVTLDGNTLDIADTAENEAAFGRPAASRGGRALIRRSALPRS